MSIDPKPATASLQRIMEFPLRAKGESVVGGHYSDYFVTNISDGMNDQREYARLFASAPALVETLRSFTDCVAEIIRRGGIKDEVDARWMDHLIARSRSVLRAAIE